MRRNARALTLATLLVGAAVALAAVSAGGPAVATHIEASEPLKGGNGAQLVIPLMDPERGKKLFVDKGCVACHAVNGVGGHGAPTMDAHRRMGLVNPFDFAAKMWNHAPAMIAAQEEALGEQIYFTGQEMADIIAFVHNDAAQHGFGERDLTPRAREMMDHEHGGASAPDAHSEEIGHGQPHGHTPGTPKHKD